MRPWTATGSGRFPGASAGGTDLVSWVEHQRAASALADWPEAEYQGLRTVAGTAQDLLDEVGRACLVHSDFNPKNLLIDPAAGTLTGLVDWEFAHAGAPMADLGNLLRFERDPAFARTVMDGYLEVAGHLDGLDRENGRERLLGLARAADLVALAELAGRRGENAVADRADAQLRAVAASGSLHATARDGSEPEP